uniref:Uncharacterized protein n=1 Tax=Acanthochromis polyacanthus TaxID=80966 RepID=A0A3Q1GP19_9TELE
LIPLKQCDIMTKRRRSRTLSDQQRSKRKVHLGQAFQRWREFRERLSFGSCGLLSGAEQFLCMRCGRPSLPPSRAAFILSR